MKWHIESSGERWSANCRHLTYIIERYGQRRPQLEYRVLRAVGVSTHYTVIGKAPTLRLARCMAVENARRL